MSLRESLKTHPDTLIARAYAFAEKAHRAQKRRSGEPYFNHVVATAEILSQWHMDEATVAAGLLHDTVEDTGVPLETIRKEFGDEIAFLVDGVTKLGRLKYRGVESKAENMRKMVLALSQDLRVVFIKLADRMHNMHTLDALPPAKQKRIALETSEIYAPLAYRLGMYSVSGELEDIAFAYLSPKEYEWLKRTTEEQYAERLAYLESIKPAVEELLKKHEIKNFKIDFRAKRYSSLYKKLLKRNMDIGSVHDLVAMRVIVDTIPECYAVLGVIHEAWPPMPGRIKDYIALPKPNAYRSLHTTVIGPDEHLVEFQIRTREMHEESEYGVAAHWLYKEKDKRRGVSPEKLAHDIAWVRQLREWQDRVFGSEGGDAEGKVDAENFLEAMKIDFFRHRIFVITPRGDVIDLPAGATPIDFAYHVHSELGDQATGARVNGILMPLDHELASGDMVEIVRQRGKKPSEDWLKFAKTEAARNHIRAALRAKDEFVQKWHKPNRCSMKIVIEDRIGLIQDLSTLIAQNHINILSYHAEHPKGGKLSFERVELAVTDAQKIAKLVVKIKRIKGVKEVSYKLV
jgi:GTP diphosphokinase / guanosine-3',5'-bis(diphosphate) 3'-diphosphatase